MNEQDSASSLSLTIETSRLTLRTLERFDVDRLQQLLQEKEIAANTRNVPHPYPEGAAESWMEQQWAAERNGAAVVAAVTIRSEQVTDEGFYPLIGVIGLAIDQENHHAELGYWIGKPYWGEGYATEAAKHLVEYGFDKAGLHRIHAHHLARNTASGRVLEKIGMTREGELRQHVRKWGVFEDIVLYGMLADDPRPWVE